MYLYRQSSEISIICKNLVFKIYNIPLFMKQLHFEYVLFKNI